MKIILIPKINIPLKSIKKIIDKSKYNFSDDKTIFKIILKDSYSKKIESDVISINNITNIPEIINTEASKDSWNIFIPLTDIIDFEQDFDYKLYQIYENNYPNFDGVVLLKNENNNITIPLIGKNYFNEIGFIYNQSYDSDVYLKDFYDSLEINKKHKLIVDNDIKLLDIYENDEKIYNFRKKFNFGIYKLDKLRNLKRKKSAVKNEFNNLVDECYVINLNRRKDRMEHMSSELKNLDISYKRYDAVDGKKLNEDNEYISNPEIATIKSHIGVIKDAIYNEYNKIAVFEDDIVFCDDFNDRLKYYINNIPGDWDIMYLASNLNSCQDPTLIKPGIYKIKNSYGCFAMILNNKNNLFQKIINGVDYTMPYDNYIRSLQKDLNCYVFMPFFVKTLYTQSDINPEKGEFSYNVVDKNFAAKFEKPVPVMTKPQPQPRQIPRSNIESRSIQSICEDYQRGSRPFIIYYGGRVLFDSEYTDKNNLRFDRDHFVLYGKYFSYSGMVIKMKMK